MQNVSKLKPISSISFINENERITLTEGDKVLIIIDDMYYADYKEEYSGEITFVNDEMIEVDGGGDPIPWKYISTICHV